LTIRVSKDEAQNFIKWKRLSWYIATLVVMFFLESWREKISYIKIQDNDCWVVIIEWVTQLDWDWHPVCDWEWVFNEFVVDWYKYNIKNKTLTFY